MRTINEDEIRQAVFTLHPPDDEEGCLFEVRVIDGSWNLSGYFTSADALIDALKHSESHANENIYITLNYVSDACYARKQHDRLMKNATPTTSDSDIFGYRFLMIDLDPERAAGTSSSDDELENARKLARTIFKYMKATGWNDPIIAESGNGVHLLYRIGLEVTAGRIQLVKDCLTALDIMFSTDAVKVDTKTYNPARVCKLYGTMAKKGADTKIRPHRMSRMIYVPDILEANDIALCEVLAANIPKQDEPRRGNNYQPRSFDLRDFIQRHGIPVKKEIPWNGGTKFVLDHCLFNAQHKHADAAIVQTSDGKICYNCFHNSCADKHWREVRLLYEPHAYDAPHTKSVPNYERPKPQTVGPEDLPVWLTTEQIRQREHPKEEYIRTGIRELDAALIGLKKGFVTLISGLRACGKSSMISQITLQAAEQNHRTALFSGELTPENALRWMYLQAAGKQHTKPTQYEGRWYTPEAIESKISKWLDGRLYIYDNDFGFDYDVFSESLERCIVEYDIDLVILDNMMCLDLSTLDRDIFVRQSVFVNELEQMAKRRNVHIILIAHPRKSNGFLRLQDVSGSNDIVNRVDNAIIMHRVNHDFTQGAKTEFRWNSDNPIFSASNVLEICKDRDNGTQDKFIPLYFEPESKRLKNEPAEAFSFSWENEDDLEEPPF